MDGPNDKAYIHAAMPTDNKTAPPECQCHATDNNIFKVISLGQSGDGQMVRDILHQKYGLTLTSFEKLHGFDDANYLVRVDGTHSNPYVKMEKSSQFVLRIINANDSRKPERINAINAVMKHVKSKGIVTQESVKNLQGGEMMFHTIYAHGNSMNHVVILRSFLPGTIMETQTMTPVILFNCGVIVARITRALEDFQHHFFDDFVFSWSLDNDSNVKDMLPATKNSARRHLVEKILDACQQEISSVNHQLETGQIHADLNLSNIILLTEPRTTKNNVVPGEQWGIIDFHDTHKTLKIYELAISSALIMTRNQPIKTVESLDIPGHILAGYHSVINLTLTERYIFPYLVIRHLCTVLIGCQFYYELNPSNTQFLDRIINNGWPLLEKMWEMTPSIVQAKWEQYFQD